MIDKANGTFGESVSLNLGCGKKRLPGYLGVDCFAGPEVDVVHNLETFPWPFSDGSVDRIMMDNVLEHLSDTVTTMEEIHRILRIGGEARIIVPHVTSTFAHADPTHKRLFTDETFEYFTSEFAYNYYTSARFRIASLQHIVEGRGIARLRRYIPGRRVLMKFFWNLCDAIDVVLIKDA